MTARHRHHVYVVELDPVVLNDRRFARANPGRDPTKPCVYVGMTGLTPELRFARHKAGIKANRFVLDHGLRLLPQLYAWANPMPYEAACEGFSVWQA